MEAGTLERVFEPFFTTKPQGAGTGLGMSTVYGIVKQSEGYIWVDSAPGTGTVVRVYLPRVDEPHVPVKKVEAGSVARGSETVLLVEDDDSVRALTRRVLHRQGYQVLEARNGVEALRIAEPPGRVIDLVISDVVMPELGGRQLAERLRTIRPEVPVLLMSGYTDDAIVRLGIEESGEAFLPKPFTNEALARKVRAMLDASSN
jgi:CheY-like chemotaxis protein